MKNSIQKLPICFIDSSVPLLKNLFVDSIMNTKKRLAQAKRLILSLHRTFKNIFILSKIINTRVNGENQAGI